MSAGPTTGQQIRGIASRPLSEANGVGDFANILLQRARSSSSRLVSFPADVANLVTQIPGGVKAGVQSIGAGLAGAGELAGVPGAGVQRDKMFRRIEREGAQAEAVSPGASTRMGRGVGRTVTEVGLASPLGRGLGLLGQTDRARRLLAVAGTVAPVALSAAEEQGEESGLQGAAKLRYTLESAAIDTGLSMLFPGGAERLAGALPALQLGWKKALLETGSEVAEESAASLAQAFLGWIRLPENQGKTGGQAFQEWLQQLPETAGVAAIAGGGAALATGRSGPAAPSLPPVAPPVAPELPPEPHPFTQRAQAITQANEQALAALPPAPPLTQGPIREIPAEITPRQPALERPAPTFAPTDAAEIRARVGDADTNSALVPRLPPAAPVPAPAQEETRRMERTAEPVRELPPDPYPGLLSPDESLRADGFTPRQEAPQAPPRVEMNAGPSLDAARAGILSDDPNARADAYQAALETPGLLKVLEREGRKDPAERLKEALKQAKHDARTTPTILSAEDAALIPPPEQPSVRLDQTSRTGEASVQDETRRMEAPQDETRRMESPAAPPPGEIPTARVSAPPAATAAPAQDSPDASPAVSAAEAPTRQVTRPPQSERLAEIQTTLAETSSPSRIVKGKPVPLGTTYVDWKAGIEPQLTTTERTGLARKQKVVSEARERLRALTQARAPNETRIEAQRAKLATAQAKLDEARADLGWTAQHNLASRSQDNARRAADRRATGEVDPQVPFQPQKGNKDSRTAQSLAGRAAEAARAFKAGAPEDNAARLRSTAPSVMRQVNAAAETDTALKEAVDAAWAWQDANRGFGSQSSIPLDSLPYEATTIPEAAPVQSWQDATETRQTVMAFVPHVDPSAFGAGVAQALAIANEPGGSAMVKAQKMAEATGLDQAYTLDAITNATIEGRNVTLQDLGLDDNCGL